MTTWRRTSNGSLDLDCDGNLTVGKVHHVDGDKYVPWYQVRCLKCSIAPEFRRQAAAKAWAVAHHESDHTLPPPPEED